MNFFISSYISDTTLYGLPYLDCFCQREWASLKISQAFLIILASDRIWTAFILKRERKKYFKIIDVDVAEKIEKLNTVSNEVSLGIR